MSFLPGQRSVQICWNYLLSYFCERVSFHESGRYTVAGGVELPEVILKDRVTPHEEESHSLCLILNGARHHGEKCWVITSWSKEPPRDEFDRVILKFKEFVLCARRGLVAGV